MGRIFDIAGPCNPEQHYMLPATARVPDVKRLIGDMSYFVVHAQRQLQRIGLITMPVSLSHFNRKEN